LVKVNGMVEQRKRNKLIIGARIEYNYQHIVIE